MLLPRQLILLLTLCAYAAQALAGVADTGCRHEAGSGVVVAATGTAVVAAAAHAQPAHEHAHEHGDHVRLDQTQMQQMHAPAADHDAAGHDCCPHCGDGNCSCGSHGCASAHSGVLPAAAALAANAIVDVPVARAFDARLRQAHSFGLIRPPSRS